MGLPLMGIAVTLGQLPSVISRHGEQQFRSLFASFDILLITFTSNAVVLGSLLQDRGYKKTKYKHGAAAQGFHTKIEVGKPRAINNRWGSDEDLMRSIDTDSKNQVLIGLEELPIQGQPPATPPRARMPEIRINSTWEVHVEERYPKD